jgi:hypothetical protein
MSTANGSVPESAANNPGYCDSPDEVTKTYHVQQTVSSTHHFKAKYVVLLSYGDVGPTSWASICSDPF